MGRIFAERKQTVGMDLEAVEMAIRAALHQAGAASLTQLLQFPEPAAEQRGVACPCGRQARYRELRSRCVLTVLGEVELLRTWYLCRAATTVSSPLIACSTCQVASFDHGREQMKVLAGLEVTAKSVERTAEAVGADTAAGAQSEIRKAVQFDLPVTIEQADSDSACANGRDRSARSEERDGGPQRQTRRPAGAHARSQTGRRVYPDHLGQGRLRDRDPDSTTCTGGIETAEESGKRIYLEAWNPGWSRAEKKVVMGDGAEWIWNLVELHFLAPEKIRTEADYFERNAERMQYPKFRRQRLFVGSGGIEAGCKTVIGSRLKQSGMFRAFRGANSIIALRCCRFNGPFENYWEARRAA